MARDDHPLTGPATLADVAARAGVSRQTVSNAVNSPDLLRADTLARVQAAIDELGYSPNRAARSLRLRSSRLIGLRVTPAQEGTANALMDRFVHSLVQASAAEGYHVLLFADDDTEPLSAYEKLLRATAVDAFVVTDTYLGAQQAAFLDDRRVPYVAFGRPWTDGGLDPAADHPWVDVDGCSGIRTATEHLIGQGHERIAWLGWSEDSYIGNDRRQGWVQAMTAAGRDLHGLVRAVPDTVDAATQAARDLLDDEGVSAFVCASDTLAMGVLTTLGERALRWGRDIAVVGYDDSQVAQVVPGGLTSVRPPLEAAAVEVVKALHRLLVDHEPSGPGVLLTPSLAVRGSSRSDATRG